MCVRVCIHFTYFISTKNHYVQVQATVWKSKCFNPFHEKSNVFHRNEKCDDRHLTSMTNIMVRGNSENNKHLLEKIMICFSPGYPRHLSLRVLPPAAVTQSACSNIQGSSEETCLPEHKLQGNSGRCASTSSWCAWQESSLHLQWCPKKLP